MPHPTDEELGFSKPPNPPAEKLTVAQRQARMLQAMATGMQNQATIEDTLYRLWKITPNFRRKDWKELILFLKEAGDPVDKLEAFAKYWERDDWRGKQGQPPTADQIHELLPRALDKYGKNAVKRTWADVANEE